MRVGCVMVVADEEGGIDSRGVGGEGEWREEWRGTWMGREGWRCGWTQTIRDG